MYTSFLPLNDLKENKNQDTVVRKLWSTSQSNQRIKTLMRWCFANVCVNSAEPQSNSSEAQRG